MTLSMDLDRRGLIGTIAFHLIILTLFLFFGFRTSLPLPGEAGILVNFGDVDLASGEETNLEDQAGNINIDGISWKMLMLK